MKQFIKINLFDVIWKIRLLCAGMRNDFHAEGMGDFRHFPADATKPDDADGLMGKFMQRRDLEIEERTVRPGVLMDCHRMAGDVHGMLQNECEDGLRDGIRV